TPEELTATNLALSVIESAGLLIGPLVGVLLLHGSSVGIVFLVAAAPCGISVLLSLAARIDQSRGAASAGGSPFQSWTRAFGRLRCVASRRDTAVVLALCGAQNLVAGALNVLIVFTALRLLDLGQSSVGALTAAFGVGTLLAPVLVHSFGVRGALIATGVPLPLLACALWTRISRLDGDAGAERRTGRALRRHRDLAVLGPSDFFEIALLRDVLRTATVRTREDALLLRLGREPFLETVAGKRASASAADAVVGARFGFGTT